MGRKIQQSMRILALTFVAEDRAESEYMRIEWRIFKYYIRDRWPKEIRQLIVLLVATIGCRIPLAAVLWARQKFVPVTMRLPDSERVVMGLLAKHACANLLNTNVGPADDWLGRYPDRDNCGRDLTLAVPKLNMPVGLVPDFTHDQQTGREVAERLAMLGCGPREAGTLQLVYIK
jgi:hypothetical protein